MRNPIKDMFASVIPVSSMRVRKGESDGVGNLLKDFCER